MHLHHRPASRAVHWQPRRPAPRFFEHEIVVPGLDPDHDGVRIAHLTDLHVGMLTPQKRILAAIAATEAQKPDLVLLTGDYVCYSPKFVGLLGELTRGLSMPVYTVLGNHDYWTDGNGVRRVLEKNGYAVLRNGHSEIMLRHSPLTIVGVDDVITGHADVHRSFAHVRKHGSRICLTHAPNMADRIADLGPSLILAGHTHGGQVHIPRVSAKIFARFGTRYLKGFFGVRDSLLYVNSGIGSSSVPLRAGAPSEVSFFTLRAVPQHH